MRIRLAALLITVLALTAGATIARAAGGQSAAGTPSLSSRPPVALPSASSGAGAGHSAGAASGAGAAQSAAAASGAALPRTGLDVVLISLSGAALLALGSSLRLAVGGRP